MAVSEDMTRLLFSIASICSYSDSSDFSGISKSCQDCSVSVTKSMSESENDVYFSWLPVFYSILTILTISNCSLKTFFVNLIFIYFTFSGPCNDATDDVWYGRWNGRRHGRRSSWWQ